MISQLITSLVQIIIKVLTSLLVLKQSCWQFQIDNAFNGYNFSRWNSPTFPDDLSHWSLQRYFACFLSTWLNFYGKYIRLPLVSLKAMWHRAYQTSLKFFWLCNSYKDTRLFQYSVRDVQILLWYWEHTALVIKLRQ